MKKTEKMIHQNIRFRSRIDTFLVSIEEFPSPMFSDSDLQEDAAAHTSVICPVLLLDI